MTLFADDPDVSKTFIVKARTGDLSWSSPNVQVKNTGLPDIPAEWLGSPGSTRSLRVPLAGLPAGYMLFLRLVVPGDVDIELGYVVLKAQQQGTLPENPGGGGSVGVSVDHGSVGATLAITQAGSHELDLTTNLAVTVSTTGDVSLRVHGTGTVTVAGKTFEVDGVAVILVVTWPRGQDAYAAGAGEEEAPVDPGDTTPPSFVTGLSATGGEGQVTFNWTAATDAESPVKYGWRVWLTSGGATGAYTTRTSVGPVVVTGLAAGNYTVQVYSFSNGGNTTPVSATANVTVNPFPGAEAYDTFTRSDGNLWGTSTEAGALTWGSSGLPSLFSNSTPYIASGKLQADATLGSGASGAVVNIGHTSATIAADYTVTNGALSLALASSSDGATHLVARIFPGGEFKMFRDGGTQIGATVTGVAMTGRMAFTYDAGSGAMTVTIDGVSIFTATYMGLTGTRSGVQVVLGSTMDNVRWDW